MSDKYKKIREILEGYNYPMVYPFKFIFLEDQDKLVQIKNVFDETAEFSVKASKEGKYTAITIKQMMLNAEDIISKYEQMEKIKGVITL
ncbi:MAG: DUF493 family protein [Crocinitomicaceae bacterium]